MGDGWIAGPMPADVLAERVAMLRELALSHHRDPAELRIVASIRMSQSGLTPAIAASYAKAGVHHLQLEGIRGPGTLDLLGSLAAEQIDAVHGL